MTVGLYSEGPCEHKPIKNLGKKGSVGVSRDCPFFRVPPIISGKATDFKICMHVYGLNRNKSPLKIRERIAVGVVRDS